MLTVATVQVSNYEKRGAEYLAKLYRSIERHMPKGVEWRGVCFTDDPATVPEGLEAKLVEPGLTGWWAKLGLLKSGALEPGEHILYSDLDALIIGDLTDIASYRGRFAALRDPYFPDHMGSALMAWEAGSLDHVWDRFESAGRPQFDPKGDQNWIEAMQPDYDRWQDMFPGQIASFKADCWKQGGIPEGTRILVHHGHPRPHQCQAPYIKSLWNAA